LATVTATVSEALAVSCAVEVFLATALLHREQPERKDFTIQEIIGRVERESLTAVLRPGVQVHASLHCVANKAPNPLKLRMLYATGKHTRRLALPNDIGHPDRTGKIFPDEADIPERYGNVLKWARERFDKVLDSPDFWAQDAVERVRQLRSEDLLSFGYTPLHTRPSPLAERLQPLLDAKGIGVEMARGINLDAHLQQIREDLE
jgi:hypothetical protein